MVHWIKVRSYLRISKSSWRHLAVVMGMAVLFGASSHAEAKKFKIGLVLDKGGQDDKSFNAAAYRGAMEAAKTHNNVSVKVVTASQDAVVEPSLRRFAERGFDLTIGIGFIMREPLEKVAKAFPQSQFLIVDSIVDLPNVRSVIFDEHEGAFLVGAIAAMVSKTGKIGFIGGMNIPLINRFELGYQEGAKYINPKVTMMPHYVGTTSEAWKNPSRGKELALNQISQGADVLFAAAGASALGAFDAVEEKKKLIIGVDSNQNWIKPGFVLTSMLKRVDVAVIEGIETLLSGTFKTGRVSMGLKDKGIDFAVDSYNRSVLPAQVEQKANAIKEKIIQGQIKVPDYYVIHKTKI